MRERSSYTWGTPVTTRAVPLMVGCAKTGMSFTACAPEKYFPDKKLINTCKKISEESGAKLEFDEDPIKATKNADVIYTDVWVSMGESDSVWEERIRDLTPYRVTDELLENAGEQCVFMHCLPAFHDTETVIGKQIYEKYGLTHMEVTDSVFSGKASLVFDEAETQNAHHKGGYGGNLSINNRK